MSIGILFSMQRTAAARSITPSLLSTIVPIASVSYLTAFLSTIGSAEYTPSIDLAARITSASISIALRAVAVSVEKYGCPVPPARNTIFPASNDSITLSFEKSEVNEPHANGVRISVLIPTLLHISDI